MKLVVTVRTLNEEKNIERFVQAYSWADTIVVCDGGSTDRTLDIAKKYKNVEIIHFPVIMTVNGIKLNPRGKHINYLLFHADIVKHADWIIFDDCDCVPTKALSSIARDVIFSPHGYGNDDAIFAYRMFVLYDSQYFPDMNLPGQSLWAWRPSVGIKAKETDPLSFSMEIPQYINRIYLDRPYSLLHYFYPDDETMQEKIKKYNATGELGGDMKDPKLTFGKIESLPEWAVWR